MAKKVTGRNVAPQTPPNDNPLIPNARLKQLYATMLRCGLLEERIGRRANSPKRPGDSPTLAAGREAIVAGAAFGLRASDWAAPAEGDFLGYFVKGAPLPTLVSEFRHNGTRREAGSDGNSAAEVASVNLVPPSSYPVAQLNRAIGVALANRAKKNANVVVVFAGKGAPADKNWREAINFAWHRRLPVIFVVEIAPDVKEKGRSRKNKARSSDYDLPIIPVDGNDVVAIYRVAYESIHKARHGAGPTLIETHILGAHASDAKGKPRRKTAQPSAALEQMERYLAAKGLFSEKWKQAVLEKFNRELDTALGPTVARQHR